MEVVDFDSNDLGIEEMLEDVRKEIPELVGIAIVLEYNDQFDTMFSGRVMSLLGGSVRLTRYLNHALDNQQE